MKKRFLPKYVVLPSLFAALLVGTASAYHFSSAAEKSVTRPREPVAAVLVQKAPPVLEGYSSADIARRKASVAKGEVQNVNDWMKRRDGAYSLLSPSAGARPGRSAGSIARGGVRTNIVNPAHQLNAWSVSHYRYPIFAYEETVPWTRLRDGMGMNINNPAALNAPVLKTLKEMGVTKGRTDVGWGNMRFDRPYELKQNVRDDLKARVLAWNAAGIRPLICLDTHPAAPCPIIEASCRLAAPLKEGDTSAVIIARPGETPTPFKSGFSHVTSYWAAEWLWTKCESLGQGKWRVSFPRPWPTSKSRLTGAEMPCAYFKYRPWSDDNSVFQKETYAGFQLYVKAVTSFLDSLGLRKSRTDPGFDIEICNEMSNWGFHQLGWYLATPGSKTAAAVPPGDVFRVYRESVATIRANPAFKDLRLINGFHNQSPFGAASTEPAGGSAGSSHFYRGEVKNPAGVAAVEDAFGRPHEKGWQPALTIHAPETIFSAEVLENVVPNISPIHLQMWGNARGRGLQPRVDGKNIKSLVAKEPDGSPARGIQWDFTEWSDAPGYDLPISEQERLLAKFCLRGMIVGIGKGVSRIYWYAAMGPGHGLLSMKGDRLPAYEPASVITFKRLMAATAGKPITKPRQIRCVTISETHGNVQFRGNGTPEFPDLPNRDVLLPQAFQLSDTSFAISLHVMTKNYKEGLPPETYTIRWRGVKPTAVSKYMYRHLNRTQGEGIKPSAIGKDWVEFTLPVTDTPRLLIMNGV